MRNCTVGPDTLRMLELGHPWVIADRYTVLVQTVLESPQPERPRADHLRGLRDLLDFDVLTTQPAAGGMYLPRHPHQRLRFVRRPIAVLGEQHVAVGSSARKGYE